MFQNKQNNLNQGYIRHEVAADGNCGYTAFGVTREHARQLLLTNIHNISTIIKVPVKHALLTNEFYQYLFDQNIINISQDNIWASEQQLAQYTIDLAIQSAYIDYDVRDKHIDAGYSHPAILQALAHIQRIELHMWRLGGNNVLIPHVTYDENYASYIPPQVTSRIDLLFVNGNHFERLEIQGYKNDIPNEDIYPLNVSRELLPSFSDAGFSSTFSSNIDQLEITDVKDKHIYLPHPPKSPTHSMPAFRKINHYTSTTYEAALHEILLKQEQAIKQAVIYGTAGSGKTVLSEQFIARYQQEHLEHFIHKLLAETQEQWNSSLRTYAEALYPGLNEILKAEKKPEKKNQLIIQVIQNVLRENTWCILVDNWGIKSGPPIYEIEHLFCIGEGILLITTQACPSSKQANSLDLSQGFSLAESQELLLKIMSLEQELDISWNVLGTEVELNVLADTLNRLPLALVLAGSYLLWENKNRYEKGEGYFTFKDYKELLDLKVAALVEKYDKQLGDKGDMPRDISREEFIRIKTQEMAVDLSLQNALDVTSQRPNFALWMLLCFCGFLASDGIPQQILKEYLRRKKTDIQAEERFDKVIESARNYSLLQFESKRSSLDNLFSLHIHQIIQRVLRDIYWPWLLGIMQDISKLMPKSDMSNAEANQTVMADSLNYSFRQAIESRSFSIIRELLLHIEQWFIYLREEIYFKNEIILALQEHLANAYLLLSDYDKAEKIYQEVLAKKINFYRTEEHESVAMTKQNLALALSDLGHYEEAKQFCEESLNTTIKHYGTKNHIEVAITQQNLASILSKLNQYNKAKVLYEESLYMKIKHYKTKKHVSVATTQQNLAGILLNLNNFDDAKLIFEEALATKIAHYGDKAHVDVAIIQKNLATVLKKLGNYKEAKSLYEEALITTIEHHKTEEHIEVASVQRDLADVLTCLDFYNEAKVFYKKALKTTIAHYKTEKHIKVAAIQEKLIVVLIRLGLYEEAKPFCQNALTTTIAHYKTEKHIEVASIQQNFASVLMRLGFHNDAKDLYKKSLTTVKAHYGTEDHIDIAIIKQNLGLLLEDEGCFDEAKLLYEETIATKIKFYGTKAHQEVAVTQQNLANVLKKLCRYTETEVLYQEALATKIKYYKTTTHISVALTQYNLAELYLKTGDFLLAYKLFMQFDKTFIENPGGIQYMSICVQFKKKLFFLISLLKTYKEAHDKQNYKESIRALEAMIEIEPNKISYHNLGCVYHLCGIKTGNVKNFDQAKKCFEQALSIQKSLNTQVEYANFLRERQYFSEALIILEEALIQEEPTKNDGLSYNISEAQTLPTSLAEKVTISGEISIKHSKILAHYMKICCLLENKLTQEEAVDNSLHNFYMYLHQLKQNNSDAYLPIYDWLLENAYVLSENVFHKHTSLEVMIINTEHENFSSLNQTVPENNLLHSLKNDIYTLFRQGYHFSTESHGENKLKILVTAFPKPAHDDTLLISTQKKLSELVMENNKYFQVKQDDIGAGCIIKGNSFFIKKIRDDLMTMTKKYEQEENATTCFIS